MTTVRVKLFIWILIFAGAGCTSTGQFVVPTPLDEGVGLPPDSTLVYSIFLIGDAGYSPPDGLEPPLQLLTSYLESADSNAAVIFLGDNIYPSGMPPASDPEREQAEYRMMAQIEAVRDFPGTVVFIPGNHDWGREGLGGSINTLRRQEQFVESALDRGNTFLPDNGFPGPVEVELNDDLMLVVLDTQWWLEPVKTYGDTGQYELEQEGEFLLELHNVLRRNAENEIIVVGHHPLFSNSSHAGRKAGGFLSSLEMIVRRYLGTPQDLSNLKYRRLRKGMIDIFSRHEGLIYAAGHDHNLQYFAHKDQHYIVSGSGSKLSYAHEGLGAGFTAMKRGFAILRYYTDGSVWVEFLGADEDQAKGESLYLNRIKEATRPLVAYRPVDVDSLMEDSGEPDPAWIADQSDPGDPALELTDSVSDDSSGANGTSSSATEAPYAFYSSETVMVRAGDRYNVNQVAELFLGARYRDIWEMPIPVPVIDLERTAGGLTPLQMGGGLQTRSLRLLGADGDQYVLRSVDKDPENSIPEYLRETIAEDVVQDQISAIHPYAAFIIPRLAEAAGIYHTSPRLVIIPDSERLGIYREDFAGMLALFESRPDEDQSDEVRFGNAENVIGSPKLFEELLEDNDERVDERAFVRARLFDMLIGDWDRHKDQWRWAEFDVTPGKIYRPIPRDRDFAFFRFDGLLSRLARWSGVQSFRRLTKFDDDFNDLIGLNFNGAALDRRFTSSLTRSDWVEIADSIRTGLTDEVIEEAVREWPEPVFEYHGEQIIEALKKRRDKLPEVASDYYKILAHTVDVVGSDKHERFEVTRIDDDRTEVVMYKTKKEGDIDRELFRRTFTRGETEEIRLYGLGGVDQFIVKGSVRKGILVRAIGGQDEDTFVDSSSVGGLKKLTVFYDTIEGNEWVVGRETRVFRSDDPLNNEYEMMRYEQDFWHPVVRFGRNSTDGVMLGGGVRYIENGYRKYPYAAMHEVVGKVATGSSRYDLAYTGRYTRLFGTWDGAFEAELVNERNFHSFYGLGNETEFSDRERFRARIGHIEARGTLTRTILPFTTVTLGPHFQVTNVDPLPGSPPTLYTTDNFVDKYYAGVYASFDVDGTDSLAATESGMRWLNQASLNVGIRNTSDVFLRLASELRYFYTFVHPDQVTLGFRIGGSTNIGSFSFYQANTLGGEANLRGYHRTRFAGRSSVYVNTDIRARLFDFNAYVARGEGGLLGFFDIGRVWADGEESGVWHPGAGGGIWVSPFYRLVVTGTVGVSPDHVLFNLSMGFLF